MAIDSVEDMKILFDQIPLDQMSVSMTMNGAVLPIMAFYIVAAEEQGVAAEKAERHHSERHSERVHGAQHLHLSARAFHADDRRHLPVLLGEDAEVQLHFDQRLSHAGSRRDRRSSNSATRWRTAWSTSAPASRPGLDIDTFAPRLSFFWGIGMNHFMEIAKMRAARVLWAKIIKGFNPKNPKSMALRTHSQTSGWSLTAQDVFNNVPRTCVEALAAVLGHTQSLHTNALDEAIALPTRFLGAHRAQHADLSCRKRPASPRWWIPGPAATMSSRLTHELMHKAWHHIQEIEALGGMAKAIETGIPKMRIEEAAARRQAQIDSGRETIVGVNKYQPDEEEQLDVRDGGQQGGARFAVAAARGNPRARAISARWRRRWPH